MMSKKIILSISKDKVTGRREISIGYVSDPDALSYEHEEDHADIVAKLGLKGLAKRDAGSVGNGLVKQEEVEKEAIAQK